MYFYMDMAFESKEKMPDFGSIKMYFVGTKELGYIVQGDRKFRKYALLSSDLSKLNLITNAINGSVAFLVDTGETYKLSNSGWQKWSDSANTASLSLKSVEELPQVGQAGYIYLVPNSHDENDNYDEYIWTSDQAFEKIGNTTVNLDNYITKDDISFLSDYQYDAIQYKDPKFYMTSSGKIYKGNLCITQIPQSLSGSENEQRNFNKFLSTQNERIKYYYGDESGLTILNGPANETTAYFLLKVQYIPGSASNRWAYLQTLIIYNSGNIYKRYIRASSHYGSTGYNFEEWEKIYPLQTATQNTNGLISSTDKTKLDSITPSNLLTKSDIIICTQQEYDAMNNHQGLLYFIKEVSS